MHACETHILRAACHTGFARTHVGMYQAVRKLQSPSDGCGRTGYWREAIRVRCTGGEPAIFETEKRRHDRLIREHLIYSFTVAWASSRAHTVVQMGRIVDARSFHHVKSVFAESSPFCGLKWVNSGRIYYGTILSHSR